MQTNFFSPSGRFPGSPGVAHSLNRGCSLSIKRPGSLSRLQAQIGSGGGSGTGGGGGHGWSNGSPGGSWNHNPVSAVFAALNQGLDMFGGVAQSII